MHSYRILRSSPMWSTRIARRMCNGIGHSQPAIHYGAKRILRRSQTPHYAQHGQVGQRLFYGLIYMLDRNAVPHLELYLVDDCISADKIGSGRLKNANGLENVTVNLFGYSKFVHWKTNTIILFWYVCFKSSPSVCVFHFWGLGINWKESVGASIDIFSLWKSLLGCGMFPRGVFPFYLITFKEISYV